MSIQWGKLYEKSNEETHKENEKETENKQKEGPGVYDFWDEAIQNYKEGFVILWFSYSVLFLELA